MKTLTLSWPGYVLWILAGIGLILAGWYSPPPPQPAPLSLAAGQYYCLTDTVGKMWLFSCQPATRLSLTPAGLQVGKLTLPVSHTTLGNNHYRLPVETNNWKRVMTSLLGGQTTDSARRWQTTRQQWRQFVKTELDSLLRMSNRPELPEEQWLTLALLRRIEQLPGQAAYQLDSSLYALHGVTTIPVQTRDALRVQTQPQPLPPGRTPLQKVGLGLGLLAVLAGLFLNYSRQQEPVEQPSNQEAEEPEVAEDALSEPDSGPLMPLPTDTVQSPLSADPSLLDRYLHQFYERYGNLYQRLQEIPIEPTESQKQDVRRQLVEMALHAHSLARAYKHSPSLDRITNEPNLQLIWQNKNVQDLPADTYKRFEQEPYEFIKKHQFLQQILQEMNLGQLNGVLMQTIYLPPSHL